MHIFRRKKINIRNILRKMYVKMIWIYIYEPVPLGLDMVSHWNWGRSQSFGFGRVCPEMKMQQFTGNELRIARPQKQDTRLYYINCIKYDQGSELTYQWCVRKLKKFTKHVINISYLLGSYISDLAVSPIWLVICECIAISTI